MNDAEEIGKRGRYYLALFLPTRYPSELADFDTAKESMETARLVREGIRHPRRGRWI